MQTKLTTEYHVQLEEPGTQTLRVRGSEGGRARPASLISTVTCHVRQHHMPCAPFVLRRDLQDSKPRLSLLLAAHTDTNNNNTITLLRGATTPKVSKARGVPNASPSTSFELFVCASESEVHGTAAAAATAAASHSNSSNGI
jgi:hypothetical protein